MNNHNSRLTVWAVRVTPVVEKVLDVLLPAVVIGSFGTALYVFAVLTFSL